MTIEYQIETDGRWIAEIPEIPGVIVYGKTKDEATINVILLAFQVMIDRIIHLEMV